MIPKLKFIHILQQQHAYLDFELFAVMLIHAISYVQRHSLYHQVGRISSELAECC